MIDALVTQCLGVIKDGAWSPCAGDLIHIANVLYLISYLVRDILWLRALTIVAGGTLMGFYVNCHLGGADRRAEIIWGIVFIAVNLFQIFLLVKERWPRRLEGLERSLYDGIFHSLTPGEFVKLVGEGTWRDGKPGETLVEDGSVVEHMMVLAEGEAEVRSGDKVLARLEPGQFVGEMSFLTGAKAGASVISNGETKVLSWPQKELERFFAKNGELSFKVRGVIGRDLVGKLRSRE